MLKKQMVKKKSFKVAMARLSVRGHKALPFLAYCHLLDADCTYGKQILTTQPWIIITMIKIMLKRAGKGGSSTILWKTHFTCYTPNAATAACKTVAIHSIWYKLCFMCCLWYNYITLNFVFEVCGYKLCPHTWHTYPLEITSPLTKTNCSHFLAGF